MNKSKKTSKNNYSLPIYPLLETRDEWRAFLIREDDPVISFELAAWVKIEEPDGTRYQGSPSRVKDAFDLRQSFFEIRTAEDAIAFFQEFGPYQLKNHLGNVTQSVKLSQILSRAEFFRNALFQRSTEKIGGHFSGSSLQEGLENIYLWQNLPIELAFRQPMSAVVRCKDVEDALRATVFLDRLRGMPWKQCARVDCGKPFEVKGKRVKLYCSDRCSHLQAVRDYNRRQLGAKASKPARMKKAAKPVMRKGKV